MNSINMFGQFISQIKMIILIFIINPLLRKICKLGQQCRLKDRMTKCLRIPSVSVGGTTPSIISYMA